MCGVNFLNTGRQGVWGEPQNSLTHFQKVNRLVTTLHDKTGTFIVQ